MMSCDDQASACPGPDPAPIAGPWCLNRDREPWRSAIRRDLDGRLAIAKVRWDAMDPGDDATIAEGRAYLGAVALFAGRPELHAAALDRWRRERPCMRFRQGTCDPDAP